MARGPQQTKRLLSDSGKLVTALKKFHGYGTTISTPFYSLLGSLNPLQILTYIIEVTAF